MKKSELKMVGDTRKEIAKQAHGSRIRLIRKRERLTQEKLAEFLGIDTKTLSCVENGDSFLKSEGVVKLYLEFGYSPDWIYGISEIPIDNDKIYQFDIRDIIQIENGLVTICIKKYIYDLLANTGKSESITELDANEDTIRWLKGISKQKRLLVYSQDKKALCCTSVDVEQFTIKTDTEQK